MWAVWSRRHGAITVLAQISFDLVKAYSGLGNRNRTENSAAHAIAPKGLRKCRNDVKKEKIP